LNHPWAIHRHCPKLGIQAAGISVVLGSLRRLGTGFFGTIPALAADTAITPNQSGYLVDGLVGFQQAVNLVSFFLSEVLVHWATSTWRLKRRDANVSSTNRYLVHFCCTYYLYI